MKVFCLWVTNMMLMGFHWRVRDFSILGAVRFVLSHLLNCGVSVKFVTVFKMEGL